MFGEDVANTESRTAWIKVEHLCFLQRGVLNVILNCHCLVIILVPRCPLKRIILRSFSATIWENLVFSLPLIFVTGTERHFEHKPLHVNVHFEDFLCKYLTTVKSNCRLDKSCCVGKSRCYGSFNTFIL